VSPGLCASAPHPPLNRHPGRKTSISIEDEFWNSLNEIAGERGMSLAAMIGAIHDDRKHATLSSAIRLFVLGVYRDQLASWGRH
jgi:predicted DNA-binding ribbon-helix-helix protein